jgi:hypothetical protein
MRLKPLIILIAIFASNCTRQKNIYVGNLNPVRSFKGYGVILFQQSFNGTTRYMEFYPLIAAEEFDKEKLIDEKPKNGIVIVGYNQTPLWFTLKADTTIVPNEDNYGKAFIFIDYKYIESKDNYISKVGNEITFGMKSHDVQLYYVPNNNDAFKVLDFKIIKALNE